MQKAEKSVWIFFVFLKWDPVQTPKGGRSGQATQHNFLKSLSALDSTPFASAILSRNPKMGPKS